MGRKGMQSHSVGVADTCAAAGGPTVDSQSSAQRPGSPVADAATAPDAAARATDGDEDNLPAGQGQQLSRVPKAWKTLSFVLTLKKMESEKVKNRVYL